MLADIGLLVIVAVCTAASSIVRPCDVRDYRCVGNSLSAHSQCSPAVKGRLSSHYVVHQFQFETPSYRASNVDVNLHVRNHDRCHLAEFFFDYDKDVAVLGIDCPCLLLDTNRTVIKHRSSQEDQYYTFQTKINYPLVRLTLNVPHVAALDVCAAFVFADLPQLPTYRVYGGGAPPNLLDDSTALLNYELESVAARASPVAKIFISALLCDFGCTVNATITDLS